MDGTECDLPTVEEIITISGMDNLFRRVLPLTDKVFGSRKMFETFCLEKGLSSKVI